MQWLFEHLPPKVKLTQEQLHQHWRNVGGVPNLVLRSDLDAAIHSAIRNTTLDEVAVFPVCHARFFLPYLLIFFFLSFREWPHALVPICHILHIVTH